MSERGIYSAQGSRERGGSFEGCAEGLGVTNATGDPFEVSPVCVGGLLFWCHWRIQGKQWAPLFQ